MDDRRRSTRGTTGRQTKERARTRITKEHGRLADYSSLKTAAGVVIPEVRKVLLDRQQVHKEDKARRTHIMYPSEMCKTDWCPRATYWRMKGTEESASKPSMQLESVFAEGHAIHEKWQNWLSDTGKMWGDWRCTRCGEYISNSLKPDMYFANGCIGVTKIEISGIVPAEALYPHDWKYKEVTLKHADPPISGHADGALTDHNILIEIKSMSVGGLRYDAPKLIESATVEVNGRKITDIERVWKDFHHPLAAHLRQGNLYMWMCSQMGLPFDKMSFIYEFKSNQQAKEFVIPYSFEIVEPLISQAVHIMAAIEKDIPPDCLFGKGGCPQCRVYEKEN